jgi:hypothetical protein
VVDAIAICLAHIDSIKATSRKSLDKVARIRAVIKGVLEGGTFADVAAELHQDRAVISRDMADTYAKWPKLKPAITLLNLLNNMAKRRELSTAWQFALQRGEQIIDDGVLIWGEWPNSGPHNHVADPDHVVKLAELQHKAFPPIRSNFGASVAAISHVTPKGDVMWEGSPNRGTQRIEYVHRNKWDYETERTDGSVRIGAFKDYGRHGAIDAWQELRETAGLPDKYFHEETKGNACIWPLHDVGDLGEERALWAILRDEAKQFSDERWLSANYNRPAADNAVFDGKSFAGLVAVDTPLRYKAPFVPFVNECKPGKRRKIHPSKYPASKNSYRGKRLQTTRFAKQVHNATTYGSDANKQFVKIPGVAEPKPAWSSADVSVHPMVHDGAKWKRGRQGTRCTPINSSLSSLPPLTRHFQFPLLPWEPEHAQFFTTPGMRPTRPHPDAVNVSGLCCFI